MHEENKFMAILTEDQKTSLKEILQKRFEKNMHRHPKHNWADVWKAIENKEDKQFILFQMESTQGAPDVVDFNNNPDEIIFCDCAPESPKGRRSFCYDEAALASRKEHKPADSALHSAKNIGIEILDEEFYRKLQSFESFDKTTSSWLKTPDSIRILGGAIFGDYRYGHVFIYHNGAESYYGARAYRGILKI